MVLTALTKTCKWILYLLAALLILIALLLACIRLAVFYSEDYSEELASLLSSYVGSPVEIGEVDLVWNRFDATANLKDVQVRDADSAESVIDLEQIELQLNVRDILLERNLSVRSVQLSNLSLVASYEGNGQLRMLSENNYLQQNANSQQKNRGHSVLNWLFNAERISILDSDITLIDAMRDREYEIDDINIRAFNEGDLHQIRVSSALPGEIGENSLASFDFTGDADDINAWQGQFYVNTSGLNIDRLSDLWRKPSESYKGTTDLQVWGKWSGTRISQVRAIVTGRDISLTQTASNAVSDITVVADDVEIDLKWLRTESGWQVKFGRLSAALDELLVLDGLSMHQERNADGKKELRVAGPDVDLQVLKPVLAYVNGLNSNNLTYALDMTYALEALRGGELKNWLLGGLWQSQGFKLAELKAELVNFSVDSIEGNPGVSDLSANILYRDGVGHLSIDNQDISLSLPGLYDSPLPALNVDGVVKLLVADALSPGWALNDQQGTSDIVWKLVSEDINVTSLDLGTSATFSLLANTDGQHLIDLHANILHGNLSKIKDYLPTRVIKPKLLNWLQTSIESGDVVRGRVELKGDLNNFAPAQGIGHFYAESDLVDARLKFRPDWPAAENMDGNVSFSASAMRGRVYKGKLRDARFSDARLYLPNFKNPVLEFQANAIGSLADMLDFAQTGPLAKNIGALFGDATGSGVSRIALDLRVPLVKELRNDLAVNGEIVLDNAQLSAARYGVDLESASGKVRFSRTGVMIDDLLVRYNGRPLAVKAIRLPGKENVNRLSINGLVALSDVMQSYGIPLVDQFQGNSRWNINIDIKRHPGKKPQVSLVASSDLSGTELKLPVPLKKAANVLHEVRVSRDFSSDAKDWWIEMPSLAKARFRIASDNTFESMAVALGKSNNTVLPWRGIALHGDAQRLDALGWIRFATGFQSNNKKADTEPLPLFANITARQMLLGSEPYIGSKDLGGMVYIAYRDGEDQVHRLENPLLNGELRVGGIDQVNEPYVAQLESLDKRLLTSIGAALSANPRKDVTNQSYDPRTLRPLDVTVKELKWDNWRFSRVALRTQPTELGLKITALTARQESMRLSGSGTWDYDARRNTHATRIDVNASFDDFGRAIATMGGGNSFAEGAGEVALSLSWPKPAYTPDLRAMIGQLLFTLRDGRILTVEPGAGRILGLFALQSLPRRLAFDFRDITDRGLQYGNVSGNLSIGNGLARTNAIVVTGPVAEILIRGSTDIVDQSYDQVIDVLPRVSGALPLLGVLSGGPVAGLTALLADGVLRGIGVNLDEIGRTRFTLKGAWDAPEWQTIDLVGNPR